VPAPPSASLLSRRARVLERFRRSGARWLLTTTFPSVEANYDVVSGDFRAINVERPPYDLPAPSRTIDDTFADTIENVLGVWDLHG